MPIDVVRRYAKAKGITVSEAERRFKRAVEELKSNPDVDNAYAVAIARFSSSAAKHSKKGK